MQMKQATRKKHRRKSSGSYGNYPPLWRLNEKACLVGMHMDIEELNNNNNTNVFCSCPSFFCFEIAGLMISLYGALFLSLDLFTYYLFMSLLSQYYFFCFFYFTFGFWVLGKIMFLGASSLLSGLVPNDTLPRQQGGPSDPSRTRRLKSKTLFFFHFWVFLRKKINWLNV